MTILIYRDGQQYGPYTAEEVRQYVNQGLIVPSDLASTPGMTTPATVAGLLLTDNSELSSPLLRTGTTHVDGNVLTWPFHQHQWWRSLWMPLLWWIPVFGTFISFGWSIGVIRRRAWRQQELPQPKDLGTVLKDGFVVACMSIFFFVIPPLLFIILAQFQLLAVLLHLLNGGWIGFLFNPGKVLWMMAERGSLEYLLGAGIIPIVCAVVAWPFFIIGELRYAATGKILSFLNVFGNVGLIFRHLGGFLSYLFLVSLIRVGLYGLSTILTPALAIAIILAVIAFAVPPVIAHWMTARLAGTLTREMCESKHI